MGRVTQPVTAEQADLSANALPPRFGAVQTRSNGDMRVRAVDDLIRARVKHLGRRHVSPRAHRCAASRGEGRGAGHARTHH
eukprot:818021-Pyramimonas_sp.AAC.1